MKPIQKQLIHLIRAALTDYVPDQNDIFDYAEIFSLANDCGYTSLIYYGALKAPGFNTYCGKKDVIRKVCFDIAKNRKQTEEIRAFSEYLDRAGLEYCLLKGTEMKPLYPNPEMRPMNDADVLVRKKDMKSIRNYLKNSGFAFDQKCGKGETWVKSGMEFEIHTRLMDYSYGNKTLYLQSAWDHPAGHYLNVDFSFVFQLVHLAKHSAVGSMPLSHVVDMFVYTRAHPEINRQEVEKQLEKMGLSDFYHNVMKLVDYWFYDAPSTELTDLMTDMAFITRKERNERFAYGIDLEKRNKGKIKFWFTLIFPNYKTMCDFFPMLVKYPLLLPACWFFRLLTFPLSKKKRKYAQIILDNRRDRQKMKDFENQMKIVGLKDWVG